MIIDSRISEWRDAMRKQFFENFKRDKFISHIVLMLKLDRDGEDKFANVYIGDVDREHIFNAMKGLMLRFKPDAYIVVGEANVILTKEPEKTKEEIERVGSISKLKDSKECCSFIFETDGLTSAELYEVIRSGDDAVMNEKPLMKTMEGTGVYMGHLNKGIALSLLN